MTTVTQPRVVRSEWTKLRSLRSSRLALLGVVGLIVGLGILLPAIAVADWRPADDGIRSGYNAFGRNLAGIYLAQLVIGALGVLLICGEHTTGTIRATLAAVPRRLPVLWGKLAVLAGVTFALSAAACLVAFLAGQAIFAQKDVGLTLGDPHVARALLGCAVYLTAVGILGLGIGTVVRSTAGGIAALFGLILVLPTVVEALPGTLPERVARWLPSSAGQSFAMIDHEPTALAPWAGFAVLCAYAGLATALAAVLLARRDV
jgi:hypothetical protein